MSTATATIGISDLTNDVRDIFAQVTRYPLEILDPTSSLEEELGIDSVKLGEVFAVIREKYDLSEKLNIPRDQLRSISTISESLQQYVAGSQAVSAVQADKYPVAASASDIYSQVREVFSTVTRYPADLFEPHANLEEDLGIDSVKLGEVFAVLRERYALPEQLEMPRQQLKTLAGIAESLAGHIRNGATPGEPTSPPQPSPSQQPIAEQAVASQSRTAKPDEQDLNESVRAVFAEVTRYPLDILDPAASLEEDLGIDSVKLGEVLAVLRERYRLPEDLQISREHLGSIATIADSLRAHFRTPEPSNPPAGAYDALHISNGNGKAMPTDPGTMANSFATLKPERKPFEGKIALVTGSGRALGKDIAVYLAGLGATVVVNSFHSREQGEETVREIIDAGGKAIHAWGSVANPQQVASMFDLVESKFGALDFFVSNASNGMLARLQDITVEHWEKAYRTNVIGLHQCALRALDLMKRRGGGKIITLSSPASHGYVDYFGCMGTVKAAVESLTKSMAIEFAPYNVQVNCVSPGPIYGDLLNKWPESQRLIGEWEQATVCDRLCVNRDVSHFVAYLLSDPVKLFTGSVLVMDGGISVRWGGVSNAGVKGAPVPAAVYA